MNAWAPQKPWRFVVHCYHSTCSSLSCCLFLYGRTRRTIVNYDNKLIPLYFFHGMDDGMIQHDADVSAWRGGHSVNVVVGAEWQLRLLLLDRLCDSCAESGIVRILNRNHAIKMFLLLTKEVRNNSDKFPLHYLWLVSVFAPLQPTTVSMWMAIILDKGRQWYPSGDEDTMKLRYHRDSGYHIVRSWGHKKWLMDKEGEHRRRASGWLALF